jgi:hypothetical protein
MLLRWLLLLSAGLADFRVFLQTGLTPNTTAVSLHSKLMGQS